METTEELRAITTIKQAAEEVAGLTGITYSLFAWRCTTGAQVLLGAIDTNSLADLQDAFNFTSHRPRNTPCIGVFLNLRQFMNAPAIIQSLKDAILQSRLNGNHIILVGPRFELPPELETVITMVDLPLPSKERLFDIFSDVLTAYSGNVTAEPELVRKAADSAVGLTELEAENSLALSMVVSQSVDLHIIQGEKEQAVKRSEVLEFMPARETLGDIGDFDLYETWLRRRSTVFTPEATSYGLPKPKGILLLGISGCLTGDTIINICRKQQRCGYRGTRLDVLWYRFNGRHREATAKGLIARKKAWDLSRPTRSHCYQESKGYIGFNEIAQVLYSGVKQVFRLTTDHGFQIKATIDHPFLTLDGFKELSALRKGDTVLCRGEGVLMDSHAKGRNQNIALRQVNNVGNHPFARWRIVGGLEYSSHPLHRLVVEAHMNNLSLEDFLFVLEGDTTGLNFLSPDVQVHHKDRDRRNNTIENLEVLSVEEHAKLHMIEGGHLNRFRLAPRLQKVMSVEKLGKMPTYDIRMVGPDHNFVANGFIVHNCGKSLLSKVTANFLGLPLIKFDIGAIFKKYVGSSEESVRSALKIIETVSPVVVLLDEMDKGFSGISASGGTDSGVTARVLATILTWMQERTCSAFIVATVNRIQGLPPEVYRAGRFDAIFAVDLPQMDGRRDIFEIHIRKVGREPKKFDLTEIAKKSVGLVGAEIECVVHEAMFSAFSDGGREFTTKDILRELQGFYPQSVMDKEKIAAIREFCRTRARPVSSASPAFTERQAETTGSEPQIRRIRKVTTK
jgi:hypothetical protein